MRAPRATTSALLCSLLLTVPGCAVGSDAARDDRSDGTTTGRSTSRAAASADPAAPPASPAAVAQRVGSVLPEAPRQVVLPSGTTVPVRSVSTTANGVLDVPEDIAVAGWWQGGSRIGDPFGSTLVAAHVDSRTQGLGPFAELLSVRPGAEVVVRTADLRQVFRVRSLRLRPQGSIGPSSVLHSPAGERRLTLVTCAGPYDAARGGYQDLAVVTAVPVGPAAARSAG